MADKWDVLAPLLEKSMSELGVITHSILNNTLSMVLQNLLECWLFYQEDKVDKKTIPAAFFMVLLSTDPFIQKPIMYIYFLTTFKVLSRGSWRQLKNEIFEYSKSKGASSLIAETSQDKMKKICKLLGAKEATTLTWEM